MTDSNKPKRFYCPACGETATVMAIDAKGFTKPVKMRTCKCQKCGGIMVEADLQSERRAK